MDPRKHPKPEGLASSTPEPLEEAAALFDPDRTPTWELLERARRLREQAFGSRAVLCSILNAKSGACSEDCSFCSQSVHHRCEAPVYPLVSPHTALERAREAEAWGTRCFSLVTSGRALQGEADRRSLLGTIERIRTATRLQVAGSFGTVDAGFLADLREAGLDTVHHNLETAPSHYDRVCTTHPFTARLETLEAARAAGLRICSGGIFGLGESYRQRAELCLLWQRLPVERIPVNFLNPIAGTPLEGRDRLRPLEALHVIAALRCLLPDREILVCGGREAVLGTLQPLLFQAGANGLMTGNYLTTRGQAVEEDLRMIEDLGLRVQADLPAAPAAGARGRRDPNPG